MDTKYGFELRTSAEFSTWMKSKQISRTVRFVQLHHTWIPSYAHFNSLNHFDLQRGMQNTHRNNNGWSDIGQHFTIFPDGKICTGRSLEQTPACIYMNNSEAVCIEVLGDFDSGRDQMTQAQRESVITCTAALCERFNLPTDDGHVVYHHWFSFNGDRNNGAGGNKSCPGTSFFGGNKVSDYNSNLRPLIDAALQTPGNGNLPSAMLKMVYVIAAALNVRKGPSTNFDKVRRVEIGSILRVYDQQGDWYKISGGQDEWVYGRLTVDVRLGTVNTNVLNVRSGPATSYPVVFQLQQGQEVAVMEERNGWYRIGMNDIWLSSSYVDLI
ncbi:MAG: SH3 domain-containing protein [Flavobacteriales bacterium]|nr:SH3 domain-containing protein [Flavobacteriales bacterium]